MELPFIFGTRDLLTGRRGMKFSTLLRGYGTCQVGGESESGVLQRETGLIPVYTIRHFTSRTMKSNVCFGDSEGVRRITVRYDKLTCFYFV